MPGYRYRALSAGTLSNPYRFVSQGETVVLDEPIKSKWLVPEDQYEVKELPITSRITPSGSNVLKVKHGPAPMTENYSDQMKAIIARENKEDGIAPKQDTGDKSQDDGLEGTGNQDVLA